MKAPYRAFRTGPYGRAARSVDCVAAFALVAVAASAICPGTGGWTATAHAQQAPAPVVTVAPSLKASAASSVRLPIQVGPPGALPKNSFVRVRGLPAAASLTEGYAIGPGAWAVPLLGLSSLTIIVPTGIHGTSEVSISLVTIEGKVIAEARTQLVVAEPAAAAPVAQPPAGVSSAPAAVGNVAAPPLLPPAERERALGLYNMGQEQLDRGNVYAARKFFERAAEIGLAQSAVALAGTYDPVELSKLKVVGLQPDPEAARKWYERARELGASEATERLRRLGARQ